MPAEGEGLKHGNYSRAWRDSTAYTDGGYTVPSIRSKADPELVAMFFMAYADQSRFCRHAELWKSLPMVERLDAMATIIIAVEQRKEKMSFHRNILTRDSAKRRKSREISYEDLEGMGRPMWR
jgi:hypothetical protein